MLFWIEGRMKHLLTLAPRVCGRLVFGEDVRAATASACSTTTTLCPSAQARINSRPYHPDTALALVCFSGCCSSIYYSTRKQNPCFPSPFAVPILPAFLPFARLFGSRLISSPGERPSGSNHSWAVLFVLHETTTNLTNANARRRRFNF